MVKDRGYKNPYKRRRTTRANTAGGTLNVPVNAEHEEPSQNGMNSDGRGAAAEGTPGGPVVGASAAASSTGEVQDAGEAEYVDMSGRPGTVFRMSISLKRSVDENNDGATCSWSATVSSAGGGGGGGSIGSVDIVPRNGVAASSNAHSLQALDEDEVALPAEGRNVFDEWMGGVLYSCDNSYGESVGTASGGSRASSGEELSVTENNTSPVNDAAAEDIWTYVNSMTAYLDEEPVRNMEDYKRGLLLRLKAEQECENTEVNGLTADELELLAAQPLPIQAEADSSTPAESTDAQRNGSQQEQATSNGSASPVASTSQVNSIETIVILDDSVEDIVAPVHRNPSSPPGSPIVILDDSDEETVRPSPMRRLIPVPHRINIDELFVLRRDLALMNRSLMRTRSQRLRRFSQNSRRPRQIETRITAEHDEPGASASESPARSNASTSATGSEASTPPQDTNTVHKQLGDCAVCLQNMQMSSKLMVTMCGHIFCDRCIKNCISTTRKCPICRKLLTMKKIHPVFFY